MTENEKEIYRLIQKAHQLSTTIAKMETQLEKLNDALWQILNKCFEIIESDAKNQKKEQKKKLNYIDP